MIDYKALHEHCRREGKSTLDLDDVAAGHPVAEAELAEQRHWLECRYHGHDYEACEKYSGQVPCDHEALGAPEPADAAVPERVLFQPKNLAHLGEWYVCEILCYSGEYVVADYCGRPKVWKAKDVVFYRTGDK